MTKGNLGLGWIVCLGSTALTFACSSGSESAPSSGEETASQQASLEAAVADASPPPNRTYGAEIVDGQAVSGGAWDLPASAQTKDKPNYKKDRVAAAPKGPKFDVFLEERVARAERSTEAKEKNATVEVAVTFRDSMKMPRFPALNPFEGRSSAGNLAVTAQAQSLATQVGQARAPEHARHTAELGAQHGAKIKHTFWLVNGLVADVPVGRLRALAAHPDVQFVEETRKPIPPPQNPQHYISAARALMNTDPYFNLGLNWGFIGMIDSGVRRTHTLLTGRIDYYRDCVNGTSNSCQTGSNLNPDDDFWDHGTRTANVLSGNTNLGDPHRGITGVTIDSFKVFDNVTHIIPAVTRGIEAAVASGDGVVAVNVQDTGDENGMIAVAADLAFDASRVVVAAAGNFGPGAGSVASPGRARKVIAAGAVDVVSQEIRPFSGRGPTTDGRTKPDVMAPTILYTATTTNENGYIYAYDGTSCAMPGVAGFATLVRNFMSQYAYPYPGFVNAFVIMSGRNQVAPTNNYDQGAGLLLMPSSQVNWGSVELSQTNWDIEIPVSSPYGKLDVAIWWPETSARHNDVDLTVINPNGAHAAWSQSIGSVFEKVRGNVNGVYGTWKIRIMPYDVSGTQTVYWAAGKRV